MNTFHYIVFVVLVFVVIVTIDCIVSMNKRKGYVEAKEYNQRFPVKDKHLKIWRD